MYKFCINAFKKFFSLNKSICSNRKLNFRFWYFIIDNCIRLSNNLKYKFKTSSGISWYAANVNQLIYDLYFFNKYEFNFCFCSILNGFNWWKYLSINSYGNSLWFETAFQLIFPSFLYGLLIFLYSFIKTSYWNMYKEEN